MSVHQNIIDRVKPYGLSPEGEAWLIQALYPPGPNSRTSQPTDTQTLTFRADVRPGKVYNAPPGLSDGATWDLMVTQVLGNNVGAYVAAGNSPVDFSAGAAGQPTAFYVDGIMSPMVTPFSTISGAVTQQAAGATTTQTAFVRTTAIRDIAFRPTYRGVTCHQVSSDLYNGGTVTAAQYDAALRDTNSWMERGDSDSVNHFHGVLFGTQPMTEKDMTDMVPGTQIREAKDGVFVPLRLSPGTPTPIKSLLGRVNCVNTNIKIAGRTQPFDIANLSALPVILLEQRAATYELPWWMENLMLRPASSGYVADSGIAPGNATTIIFRGLHKQASVSVQCFMGNEYIVGPLSPFNGVTQRPSRFDPRALELYNFLSHELATVYPASANSFGTALAAAAKLAQTYIPRIVNFVRPHVPRLLEAAKTSIPIAGQLASLIGSPAPRPSRGRTPRPEPKKAKARKVRIAKSVSRSRSRPRRV